MLLLNSLIQISEDVIERVLYIHDDNCFLIDINKNNMPIMRSYSVIEEWINEGIVTVLDKDPVARIIDDSSLSLAEQEGREKAWNIVKNIVEREPEIYYSENRKEFVESICSIHDIHANTVNRYLKKYWRYGKTKDALLPKYHNSGGRGKDKSSTGKKRGRPKKHSDGLGVGINVDAEIKEIFKKALSRYYLTSECKSLKLTYILMLRDDFAVETYVKNGVEIPRVDEDQEVPSYQQFYYWYMKNRDIRREISSRINPKVFEQNHRAIIGDTTSQVYGPGHEFSIDATIGDCYLVASTSDKEDNFLESNFDINDSFENYSSKKIIGRPVIYAVIDTYSRLIVGLNVSLEGPSWMGAMMAISNVFENKVEYCAKYDVEIEEEEWPSSIGLPQRLLADRGELISDKVSDLVSLGVSVSNTPSNRPELKSHVENLFSLFNNKFKPFVPGTVISDFKKRGDKDYRLDATLTLQQFTKILLKTVIYLNNHKIIENYVLDEDMENISPIPIDIWNFGIKNRTGLMKKVDVDIVRLKLMPSKQATVTSRGIKLNGILYGSARSLKERWHEKARNNGSFKVSAKYDPRNVEYIYIVSEDGMSFEKCYLLDHQLRYKDKSLEEVEYLLNAEKLMKERLRKQHRQSEIELYTEIEDVIETAKSSKNPETKSKSKAERLRNIRENRAFEKTVNRVEEAFVLDEEEEQSIEPAKVIEHPKSKKKSIMEMLEEEQKRAFERMLNKDGEE